MSKENEEDDNKIILEFPTKMVVLILNPFDTDVDIERLLFIQAHNIVGEIITWPIVTNRVGNLKADMEQVVAETKMDFEIFIANQQEIKRKELRVTTTDAKGNAKVEKPTKDEVENAVLVSKEYRVKMQYLHKVQRNFAYVESLYWAARDKSNKLDTYSAKLKPEEFEKEIIEGVINGIMIKSIKKAIPN